MARNAIVTGGTGALGRSVVRAALEAGDRVVVTWIVKRERDEVEALFGGALRDGLLTLVETDVSEESGADEAVRGLTSVDVLVNGVGGFAGGTAVHETDLDVWDRLYRLNVRTAVAMCRAVVPKMLSAGRGSIVNVASQAAYDRPATLAAYSASKAAVLVLTETVQKEVAAGGVRVNAVVPTTIDTAANREAMPDADFATWTTPDRIAEVILWLASDAAATVRGSAIPV